MREADDHLRPGGAQLGHGGGGGACEVGADHHGSGALERVERRRQTEEADLHGAGLLDRRPGDPVAQQRVAGEVDVAANHRHGSRRVGPRRLQHRREEVGAELELVVAGDEHVEPGGLQQLQLGHAEVLVEERVAVHQVAGVDEERLGVCRFHGAGDRGRLGDAAEGAVEVRVLRAPRGQVRVGVVDVQQGHLLRGGPCSRPRPGEDGDEEYEALECTHHGCLLPRGKEGRREGGYGAVRRGQSVGAVPRSVKNASSRGPYLQA